MFQLSNELGLFCKMFRYHVLHLTLEEMSVKTNVKLSTLSSFENGRSTNYNHILLYYNLATEEEKEFFRNNLPLERGVLDED